MAGQEGSKVVIAYDGSENSEYALDWYVKHMHRPGNHVTLVHVPELNEMLHSQGWANSVYVFDREVLESMLKKEHDRIQGDLQRFADKMKSLGLGGKVKSIASNKPGEGIAKEAQGADMVVVGSRGLGLVRRTLLGSVSDFLVHHCHCPVLVVRHPDHVEHHHGAEAQKTK
ncbi:universal stress protein Slr1101-like [Babylonia areolata]|uniref:universal stress protein Slr1101-like n=1 Tax=Babylonia areolata TaxID=304850 RepID=UPI003FD4B07E